METCVAKLEHRVSLYREGGKKMRAVLRIPRLCKQYHDMINDGAKDDFECLNEVYDRHFTVIANTEAQENNVRPVAIAERNAISRSIGTASELKSH